MTIFLLPAIYYLGGPLMVWGTQRQAAFPKLEPLGLVAPSNYGYLNSMSAHLVGMGFELIGCFSLNGQTAKASGAIAYLVHRGNGDAAIVISISARGLPARNLVEFATRFSDQGSLTTGNSKNPGVFIRPKEKPVYHFPHIENPERLYKLHQSLILKLKPGISKDCVKPGAEYERLVEGVQNEHKSQVKFGLLKLNASATHYRPTFLGAFWMTWSLVFPVKQIRQWWTSLRARRLERILAVSIL